MQIIVQHSSHRFKLLSAKRRSDFSLLAECRTPQDPITSGDAELTFFSSVKFLLKYFDVIQFKLY